MVQRASIKIHNHTLTHIDTITTNQHIALAYNCHHAFCNKTLSKTKFPVKLDPFAPLQWP